MIDKDKNLVIFCYELNENSSALGFTIDWVNEISKHVKKIHVVALRCGSYSVNSNVEVFCIKQNKKNKINTIFSIWKSLYLIHGRNKKIGGYFVHMAHYFVILIFPFAKFFRQKIVMWKAHKSTPVLLKIADKIVDEVVSSTSLGYRVKYTKKLNIVGQGIDTEKFKLKVNFGENIRNIATIGRISKSKNTASIVKAFILLNRVDLFLYVVGDSDNSKYLEDVLKIIPECLRDNVIFTGVIKYKDLPKFYNDIDLTINLGGTGSLDKAIVESMSMGIPVVTSNESAKSIFQHLGNYGVFLLKDNKNLHSKLTEIINNNQYVNHEKIREEVIINHSLENLSKKILAFF
jgi:glycosyltransferase involved in cell wall biosynthesis